MKINDENMQSWMNTQGGSEFLPGKSGAAKPSPFMDPGQDGPEPEAPAVAPGKPKPSPVLPPSAQAAVPVSARAGGSICQEASSAPDEDREAFRQTLHAPMDPEALAAALGHRIPQQLIDVYAHPALDDALSSVVTDEIKPYLPYGFLESLPKYAQQLSWREKEVIKRAKEAARLANMTDGEREEEQRRKLQARADWEIRWSGVPGKFQEADIFKCEEALVAYAEGFELNKAKNLVLRGDVGSGKTYGACAVLRLLAQRHSVSFATMGGILREIRETYGNDSSEVKVIEKYAKADVLLIDDFGKEKPTEWALQVMFEIIDTRYRENRPTIFTTQYSSGELVERLAETGNVATAKAIVSRMSDCVSVVLDGPDRRLAG